MVRQPQKKETEKFVELNKKDPFFPTPNLPWLRHSLSPPGAKVRTFHSQSNTWLRHGHVRNKGAKQRDNQLIPIRRRPCQYHKGQHSGESR